MRRSRRSRRCRDRFVSAAMNNLGRTKRQARGMYRAFRVFVSALSRLYDVLCSFFRRFAKALEENAELREAAKRLLGDPTEPAVAQ
ncbi:MAG: hypothetical protein ABFD77_02655 [Thermotogota bacterium]